MSLLRLVGYQSPFIEDQQPSTRKRKAESPSSPTPSEEAVKKRQKDSTYVQPTGNTGFAGGDLTAQMYGDESSSEDGMDIETADKAIGFIGGDLTQQMYGDSDDEEDGSDNDKMDEDQADDTSLTLIASSNNESNALVLKDHFDEPSPQNPLSQSREAYIDLARSSDTNKGQSVSGFELDAEARGRVWDMVKQPPTRRKSDPTPYPISFKKPGGAGNSRVLQSLGVPQRQVDWTDLSTDKKPSLAGEIGAELSDSETELSEKIEKYVSELQQPHTRSASDIKIAVLENHKAKQKSWGELQTKYLYRADETDLVKGGSIENLLRKTKPNHSKDLGGLQNGTKMSNGVES